MRFGFDDESIILTFWVNLIDDILYAIDFFNHSELVLYFLCLFHESSRKLSNDAALNLVRSFRDPDKPLLKMIYLSGLGSETGCSSVP
jgi:hypothetical protein